MSLSDQLLLYYTFSAVFCKTHGLKSIA
uniref:Uncharacterized protein n=1 Tax=Anguilla anguilla TaxID=7936 RepID=A0A0E9TIV4_ANGAN